MPDSELRVCLDRDLDPAYVAIAEAKAIAERAAAAGAGPAFEAALVKAKRWKVGRTLKVRFLDGDPTLQQKVAKYANEWTQHANIKFDFGAHPDAEIRVAFKLGGGSWSALGTDALVEQWFPKNQPTMNYGWLKPDSTDET